MSNIGKLPNENGTPTQRNIIIKNYLQRLIKIQYAVK